MRMLRKFLRDERGAVAIEFALIAPMFLFMLIAIIELGLTLTTQATLDGATRVAARLIRTGQVNAAGDTLASFQNPLCNSMSMFLSATSCQTSVIIDVVSTTGTSFSGLSFSACTLNSASPPPVGACPYVPGGAGDLVGVQVTYERPFLIPWVGRLLSTAADSQHVKLQSTVVFRNEPF